MLMNIKYKIYKVIEIFLFLHFILRNRTILKTQHNAKILKNEYNY